MRKTAMSLAEPRRDGLLVVIPCLDERHTLPTVLDRVLAETGLPDATFVVADGGSRDGTREWVEQQLARDRRLHLLDNVRRIQSAGVNEAVRRFGRGRRWLIRIDAHAEYPDRFVSRLVQAAEARQAQSVVVPLTTRGVTCFQRAGAAAQNSILGTGGARHRWGGRSGWVDHGHHALFDLEWFERLQGYDESFAANEDAEYDQRLCRHGGRIWIEADCGVVYFPRKTASSLYRQYRRNGAGRAQTMLLHRRWPKLRQLGPILTAPAVLLGLGAPAAPGLAAPVLVWMAGCLIYGAGLGRKARGGCEYLAGVPAMVMHLAWSIGFWKKTISRGLQSLQATQSNRLIPTGRNGALTSESRES